MSMILAATHDKYKVRELGASEVNPAEAAGGGGSGGDGGGGLGGGGIHVAASSVPCEHELAPDTV